jgi:hypothetical protein
MLLISIARNCVRALLLLAVSITSAADGNGRPAKAIVAPCTGITLSASYLADMAPDHGPGFLFRIENRTAHAIRLAEPVPSSTHWYARVGKRWLWRASAGRGGALVDALRERGPMFAYRPNTPPDNPKYLVLPAHETRQWSEPMLHNDSIAYRPSCPMCNYPGEDEYEAIFAYAYLPNDAEHAPDLLRCGLRSAPVPMPPHSSADLAGSR